MALLVAWLTTRFTTNNQRDTLVAQEVCKLLNDVGDASRNLKASFEAHYKGTYDKGFSAAAVKTSQREIQALTRDIELKREVASTYLRKKKIDKLRQALDTWLGKLEADAFPVYRKGDIFTDDDPHFLAMHSAQCEFEAAVAALKRDCLRRIVF